MDRCVLLNWLKHCFINRPELYVISWCIYIHIYIYIYVYRVAQKNVYTLYSSISLE